MNDREGKEEDEWLKREREEYQKKKWKRGRDQDGNRKLEEGESQ